MSRRLGLGCAIVAWTCAAGAAADIPQPGSQPVGAPGGLEVAVDASAACARCHAGYEPADDFEPWDSWRGAMMANAARDPVFRAALAVAEADEPDAADFCVRCHSPVAWLGGRSSHPEFDVARRARPASPRTTRGVRPCARPRRRRLPRCHRSLDPGDAQISNAELVLADGAAAAARLGPYTYDPGVDVRHDTAFSAFLSESRFCGQCHDIDNPLHDGYRVEGGVAVPTGRRFAIERTFSEWRASAFADGVGDDDRTCQGCHMAEVDHPVRAAADEVVTFLRPAMSRHDLAGASVWQPLAIASFIPDPDGDVVPALEASSARARRTLEAAARLEVPSAALVDGRVSATVRVTNLTGHKLPTGYPEGRRMWLEVAVIDAAGRVADASGLLDDVTAALVHDPQLRTYEAELGERGPDGRVIPGFHFIRNDTLVSDTRIPPRGFSPGPNDDSLPLGRAYDDGAGGFRDHDEATYSLAACGEGALSLRVRLRMQSTTAEYAAFLRDQAPPSADPAMGGRSFGQLAAELWAAHGGDVPVDMAEVTVALGDSPGACAVGDDAGVAVEDAGALDAGALDAGEPAPASSGGCGCAVVGLGRRAAGPRGLVGWGAALGVLWIGRQRARRRAR